MAEYSSEFIKEIISRGFIHQATDINNLDKILSKQENIPAYIGFDCTASSLHVGSLIQIMLLRWFQRTGHKPIILLGGGTTLVGDPSGKDESRKLLTDDVIRNNSLGIKEVFKKFINFNDENNSAIMVDNAEWLKNLNYIDFLRDFGKHFSINRMLTFDSVKLRLEREQTLSFLEFNYMILQAYDFYELNQRYGCLIQMGGSDQWGNIINGIELHRRVNAEKSKDSLFGLTSPLITTSSGTKMGKTANGAIWLNSNLCSPWDYWQFWRNTDDRDVKRFLNFFTEIKLEELEKIFKNEKNINNLKVLLANEATKILHGEEAAKKAEQTAKDTFEGGGLGADLPEIIVNLNEIKKGINILDFISDNKILPSKSEARRAVANKGFKIDGQVIEDEKKLLKLKDFKKNILKLSYGKKKHYLVKII